MPAFDPAVLAIYRETEAARIKQIATVTRPGDLQRDRFGGLYRPGIADLPGLVRAIDANRNRAWSRTDAWIEAFGGLYRLALPPAQITELEAKCGGIIGIYARVNKGVAAGKVSRAECIETLRHALVGGAVAVIDGAEWRVTPADAEALIAGPVEAMPLEQVRQLAAVALGACIHGRESSRAEFVAMSEGSDAPYFIPLTAPADD